MIRSSLRLLARALTWLISLPVTLLVLLFVIDNRQAVALSFWPLTLTLSAPLWLLTLMMFVTGFLLGGAVMWVSSIPHRRAAKKHAKTAADLRGRLDDLSRQAAALTDRTPRDADDDKPLALTG